MNRNGLSRKTNVPFVTPTFILELGDKTRFLWDVCVAPFWGP